MYHYFDTYTNNIIMKILPILFSGIFLLNSCGTFDIDMKEVTEFSNAVQTMYPDVSISAGITNGNKAEVTFTNTRFSDSSEAVRQRIAYDIGRLVPRHFKKAKIKSGEVIFENQSGSTISVTSTWSYDMGIKPVN